VRGAFVREAIDWMRIMMRWECGWRWKVLRNIGGVVDIPQGWMGERRETQDMSYDAD